MDQGLELVSFVLENKIVLLRICKDQKERLEGFSVKLKNNKTDSLRSIHSGLLKNKIPILEGKMISIGPFNMLFRINREEFVKENTKFFFFEKLQANPFYENIFKSVLSIVVKEEEEETYFDAFFITNKTNQFLYSENFKKLFNELVEEKESKESKEQEEIRIHSYFEQELVKSLFEIDVPTKNRSKWLNAKQKREIVLSSQNIDLETKKNLVEDIEDIFEELEQVQRYKIKTLEQFNMFYLHAGEGLFKSELYWTFFLKIIYILTFFKKYTLKQLSVLNEENLQEFAKGIPQPWEAFLYQNAIQLREEIKKIQKRNKKKALKKDFLLSTANALYRAVNRDLTNTLALYDDQESFSITTRAFERRGG
jgi:hypothetical protein